MVPQVEGRGFEAGLAPVEYLGINVINVINSQKPSTQQQQRPVAAASSSRGFEPSLEATTLYLRYHRSNRWAIVGLQYL